MAASAPATTVSTLSSSALAIAASVAVPFLVHLVPGGDAIGARLLPIFWAPLLAVAVLGAVPALAAAALAPLLNNLLTGMPPDFVLPGLTAELVVFVCLLIVATRLGAGRFVGWVAPVAYVVARIAVGAVTAASSGNLDAGVILAGVGSAVPGLIALLVVGAVATLFASRGEER